MNEKTQEFFVKIELGTDDVITVIVPASKYIKDQEAAVERVVDVIDAEFDLICEVIM